MKTNKQSILNVFVILFCQLWTFATHAQNHKGHDSHYLRMSPIFIQNQGQLVNEKGLQLPQVKYFGSYGSMQFYIEENKLSFVFGKIKNESSDVIDQNPNRIFSEKSIKHQNIELHRMEMCFVGTNINKRIHAEHPVACLYNYYRAHTETNGITQVRAYSKILYESIYPNIDFILETKNEGIEYYFIVHPGGDVNDIQLKWEGADKTDLMKDGGLRHYNILGYVNESCPVSYCESQKIKSSFILKNDLVRFKVESYDRNRKLIIDPLLTWSSYFGAGSEVCWTSTIDDSNFVYLAGYTSTPTGFATTGAHQVTLASAYDGYLAKIGKNGNPIWCTYYGGNYDDDIKSMDIDDSGYIYVAGETFSTSGIGTSGTYHPNGVPGGYQDGFIAKFKRDGTRVWGTYVGGNLSDNCTGITCAKSGIIYIVGYTLSTSGVATSGTYQTGLAGSYDAYVACFSDKGSQLWATYFGDTGSEYSSGISSDDSNNVYITGTTISSKKIASSNGFQTAIGGNRDAFLCKFNSNGSRAWSTYYGGQKFDFGSSVSTDKFGNIYMFGFTYSNNGIATTNAYQKVMAGDTDAFLVKFDSTGRRKWGTYFGGNGHDESVSMITDTTGNIYLYGVTKSDSGIASYNAFQDTIAGDYDTYIAKFNDEGKRIWSTYFGGNKEDFAAGISFNSVDRIYITGWTFSTSGITTPAAYNNYNGPSWNSDFVSALESPIENYDAAIISTYVKDSVCAGMAAVYAVIKNYGIQNLTSLDVNLSINGTQQGVKQWSGLLGNLETDTFYLGFYNFPSNTDTLMIWSSSPNGQTDSVIQNDTFVSLFYFKPVPTPSISGSPLTVCINDSTIYRTKLTGFSNYQWTVSGANPNIKSTLTDNYVVVYWRSAGTGNLKVVETNQFGCKDSASANVIVLSPPKPIINGLANICQGKSTFYYTKIDSGASYNWTSNGGSILSGNNSDSLYINWPNSGNFQINVIEKNVAGCSDSAKYFVNVLSSPKPAISGLDKVCKGSNIIYNVKKVNGSSYSWVVNGGNIISGNLSDSVHVDWNSTGNFSLKIVETNNFQCSDSASLQVVVYDVPTPAITGQINLCQDVVQIFQTKNNIGSSYNWVASGASVVGSSNSATVNLKWNNSGNYRIIVTETNKGGCKDTSGISVLVNPKPKSGWSYNFISGLTYQFLANDSNFSSYTWSFGDNNTGVGFRNTHVYATKGNYNVSLLVIGKEGCRDSTTQIVSIGNIGMENIYNVGSGLSVYPNPSSQYFYISFEKNENSPLHLKLLDLHGRFVRDIALEDRLLGLNQYIIDASQLNLTAGVYIVELSFEKSILRKQIVLIK